jgi:hypothetical protein
MNSVPFITGSGITARRNVAQLLEVSVLCVQLLSVCVIVFREAGKCLSRNWPSFVCTGNALS